MQINSINPYCRAYKTNSVSMKGRIPDSKAIVSRVRQFFEKNKLSLTGDINICSDGYKYPFVEVVHFGDSLYYNPSVSNHESLFRLALDGALEKVTLSDCLSVDEILYKFAKKFGGKTIYDYKSAQNQTGLSLLAGGTTNNRYNPEIQVPNFFG